MPRGIYKRKANVKKVVHQKKEKVENPNKLTPESELMLARFIQQNWNTHPELHWLESSLQDEATASAYKDPELKFYGTEDDEDKPETEEEALLRRKIAISYLNRVKRFTVQRCQAQMRFHEFISSLGFGYDLEVCYKHGLMKPPESYKPKEKEVGE